MPLDRRAAIRGLMLGSASMALPASLSGRAEEARMDASSQAPNLLVIFPDEMRAHAQGFMGEDPVVTPHIDAFARQSVVMRQMISNYPLCSPARAMFMTGQYPIRNGVAGNAHDYGRRVGIELSRYTRCWSDILKEQGYSTGYIGKWHLDAPHEPYVESYNNPAGGRYWNEWTPPDRRHGFDFWYGYGTYDRHMRPMYWKTDSARNGATYVDQWGPEHEADVAIDFLRNANGQYRDATKPFALVVSMNPPHSPYNQFPERHLDAYRGKTSHDLNKRPNVIWDDRYNNGYGPEYSKEYFSMVTGVDEQFGRILSELEAQGLSNNTLVVFFSDHGCCLGSHGEATKNNPYEESLRIPMMMRLPGKIKPGVDDALMSIPDIYPTMLELLGLGHLIPDSVEGCSLARRIMTGEGDSPSSQLYLQIPYGGTAFGKRGVRTNRHTLIVERQDGKPLAYTLYDNVNDPYQFTNIAHDNKSLVERLIKEELQIWLEKTGDPWRPEEFSTSRP